MSVKISERYNKSSNTSLLNKTTFLKHFALEVSFTMYIHILVMPGLEHCALGCWITRNHLRPLDCHLLYTTLEQFTNIPFTYAHQLKIARPLHNPGTGD